MPCHRIPCSRSVTLEPFPSAEDAWFWTAGALRARHEGCQRTTAKAIRPCEPDDILRCLDQLYRRRIIGLSHARVLRLWGDRQIAPGKRYAGAVDKNLWQEAIDHLTPMLRNKGIVR